MTISGLRVGLQRYGEQGVDHQQRHDEQGTDAGAHFGLFLRARKRIGDAGVGGDGPFKEARVELPKYGLGSADLGINRCGDADRTGTVPTFDVGQASA